MKTLYFLLAFSFSLLSSAQDWAPYKKADSIRHYLSEDTIHFESKLIQDSSSFFHPIQTIKVDQKTIDSSKTQLVFLRGLSYHEKNSIPPNYYNDTYKALIKSKVLGDTLVIFNDSTICKTIDSLGFELHFPHHYQLNQKWTFGRSVDYEMRASVDSIYWDSISGFGFDSLARFQIEVRDTAQKQDTAHPFHEVVVVLSKNYGLVTTSDFTELSYNHRLEAFNWGSKPITKNENNTLTSGDEFHAFFTKTFNTNLEISHQIFTLISDTLINTQRTIKIKRETQRKYPPPAQSIFTDTLISSFEPSAIYNTKASLLINREDCIINRQINCSRNAITTEVFGLCDACTFSPIIKFRSTLFDILFSFAKPNNDSIVYNFLTGYINNHFRFIGIGKDTALSMSSAFPSFSFSIDYLKKGNQSWGSPLRLITSLEENELEQFSFQIAPNPVQERLYFQLDQKMKIRQIEIYNLNGQLILTKRGAFNQETAGISVAQLKAGMYFISVETENGIYSRKFIKE